MRKEGQRSQWGLEGAQKPWPAFSFCLYWFQVVIPPEFPKRDWNFCPSWTRSVLQLSCLPCQEKCAIPVIKYAVKTKAQDILQLGWSCNLGVRFKYQPLQSGSEVRFSSFSWSLANLLWHGTNQHQWKPERGVLRALPLRLYHGFTQGHWGIICRPPGYTWRSADGIIFASLLAGPIAGKSDVQSELSELPQVPGVQQHHVNTHSFISVSAEDPRWLCCCCFHPTLCT